MKKNKEKKNPKYMTTIPRIDVKIDFFLTINLIIQPPSTKKYDTKEVIQISRVSFSGLKHEKKVTENFNNKSISFIIKLVH